MNFRNISAWAIRNPILLIPSRLSAARDEVLAEAPAAEAGRFRVPRILGEAP